MKMRIYTFTILMCFSFLACKDNQKPEKEATPAPKTEIEEGWIQLFDGTSTDAWKGWKKDKVGAAWSVQPNGELMFDPKVEDLSLIHI